MANPYELGTSSHPPNATPGAAAKFGVFVVVVSTIVAGAWFFSGGWGSGGATPASSTASAAAAPAGQPPATESPAPTTSPTPSASPTPNASPTPAASPKPTASAVAPRAPRPRATVAAEPAAIAPTPTPVPSPPVPQPSAEPAKPTPPNPAPERAAPVSRPPAPPPDPRIYDSATADVTPPSLLTPIGIAPIRTNYVPGLATIEVIVGRDGTVQSANAGRPPATLGETLELTNWLSAAKSWLFGPALKDGQPVKYRLVVPLSALVSGRGIR